MKPCVFLSSWTPLVEVVTAEKLAREFSNRIITETITMAGGNAADELAKELDSKLVLNDAGSADEAASKYKFTLKQTCDIIEDWFAMHDGLVGVDLKKKGAPGTYGVFR